MSEMVKFRRVRIVTHRYVTDTIELNPKEFIKMGAPQTEDAFVVWVSENSALLHSDQGLAEITRLKLSKLNYYNEDRDRRADVLNVECV